MWFARTILLTLCFAYSQQALAQPPVTIIVEQPDAPLRIKTYSAAYQTSSRYTTRGIRHEAAYENISTKKIVASQIGFVSFSIFNEFLDRTGGVDMDDLNPGQSGDGEWVATALSDFTFHTGVAYVARVRFEDGTIWDANLDRVAAQLRNIERDFDVSRLRRRDGGSGAGGAGNGSGDN